MREDCTSLNCGIISVTVPATAEDSFNKNTDTPNCYVVFFYKCTEVLILKVQYKNVQIILYPG